MHNNRQSTHECRYSAWSQRVGGLTGVAELLRALNLDPVVLLADVGIAPDALEQSDNRISYAAFGRLLETARDRANYAHFGLTVGRMWNLETSASSAEWSAIPPPSAKRSPCSSAINT